jgi:uncharacterized protein (TIGR02421 family)
VTARTTTAIGNNGGSGLSVDDLAIDHEIAQLSSGVRFLLEVTPLNVDVARAAYLEGGHEQPGFAYRTLDTPPDVLDARLRKIDVSAVADPTLQHLLRAKHREMELQVAMLRARDSKDFLGLSIELYGGVAPALREQAEGVLAALPAPESAGDSLDASAFLDLANEEIEAYREQDPDIEMHAEIRPDVSGVMVSGDTLLVSPDSHVQQRRAMALIHHEVGTHLVTQVNGMAQPVKVLGTGLAGYDETQEGLAVLAEIACGGLTSFRLRQLAGRVLTVHRRCRGSHLPGRAPGPRRRRLPRAQRVHHDDAGLSRRRADQGRDLPAGAGRPADPPARGGRTRPALPRQVLATRPAPRA